MCTRDIKLICFSEKKIVFKTKLNETRKNKHLRTDETSLERLSVVFTCSCIILRGQCPLLQKSLANLPTFILIFSDLRKRLTVKCCLFLNSDLLLEATECLLLPKRKSQIHSHRVAPRRPTTVNHVLYAIGGMSRREASKSGEKYDPRERKWKTIGKVLICIRS